MNYKTIESVMVYAAKKEDYVSVLDVSYNCGISKSYARKMLQYLHKNDMCVKVRVGRKNLYYITYGLAVHKLSISVRDYVRGDVSYETLVSHLRYATVQMKKMWSEDILIDLNRRLAFVIGYKAV